MRRNQAVVLCLLGLCIVGIGWLSMRDTDTIKYCKPTTDETDPRENRNHQLELNEIQEQSEEGEGRVVVVQRDDGGAAFREAMKQHLNVKNIHWYEEYEPSRQSSNQSPGGVVKLYAAPSFFLLGVPKAGSTTLFKWLIQHPFIKDQSKEFNFWNARYLTEATESPLIQRLLLQEYIRMVGVQLYPITIDASLPNAPPPIPPSMVSGDGSVLSIICPLLPPLFGRLFPHMKFIVLLRDPLERIYSHFMFIHQSVVGPSPGSFARLFASTMQQQLARLTACEDNNNTTHYTSPLERFKHCHLSPTLTGSCNVHDCPLCHNILTMSMYAPLLEMWWEYLPRHNFLLLRTEDMRRDPASVLDSVVEFLQLPKATPEGFQWNVAKKFLVNPNGQDGSVRKVLDLDGINKELEQKLQAFLQPYNEQLQRLIHNP